jgi:myo-inositol-1(or 4)-monophosphatase
MFRNTGDGPGEPAARTSASFLTTAIEVVRLAGAIHLAHFEGDFHIARKGATDLVTDVDIEVERMFRAVIKERFPDHGVLAEEMAADLPSGGEGRYCWLFDPLDGTANYAHGLPFFCASLALEMDGVVEVAAVFEPVRNELFVAERGRGAFRNGHAISVSASTELSNAMIGTGFPHGATIRDARMEGLLGECAIRVRGLRRLGSAALDLCYVACGRLDGFWDANLKAWDTAAGALVVAESGGAVTALDGTAFDQYSGNVLASNGRLHRDILDIVAR